jgi:hypothetical protein
MGWSARAPSAQKSHTHRAHGVAMSVAHAGRIIATTAHEHGWTALASSWTAPAGLARDRGFSGSSPADARHPRLLRTSFRHSPHLTVVEHTASLLRPLNTLPGPGSEPCVHADSTALRAAPTCCGLSRAKAQISCQARQAPLDPMPAVPASSATCAGGSHKAEVGSRRRPRPARPKSSLARPSARRIARL